MFRRSMRTARWQVVVKVSVTLLLSVVIPLITDLAHDKNGNPLLSPFEQFTLGGLVFLSVTLTTAAYEINQILMTERREQEMWECRHTVDTMLTNIRFAYHNVLEARQREENLFAQYFERILSSVAGDFYQASTKGELRVDELTFGTTDLLINIMDLHGAATIRLLHCLDARPNNFDFTTWAKSYYNDLTRMAATKRATIRRLFIYSNEAEIKSSLAQRLFAFHSSNSGYDFRLIQRGDWTAIVRGLKIPDAHSEFGVWGDLLVYRAIRSSFQDMEGCFISEPQRVVRFQEVFDVGWRMGTKVEPRTAGLVTVDDLFQGQPLPVQQEVQQQSTVVNQANLEMGT